MTLNLMTPLIEDRGEGLAALLASNNLSVPSNVLEINRQLVESRAAQAALVGLGLGELKAARLLGIRLSHRIQKSPAVGFVGEIIVDRQDGLALVALAPLAGLDRGELDPEEAQALGQSSALEGAHHAAGYLAEHLRGGQGVSQGALHRIRQGCHEALELAAARGDWFAQVETDSAA